MVWGAVIGALGAIGATALSNSGARGSNKQSFKYDRQLNADQYEYQKNLNKMSYAEQEKLLKMEQNYDKMMSNTAVQRQMQDYLNSGINPAMVVAGQGASTPTANAPSASAGEASTGSVQNAQTFGYGDAVAQAINAYSAKAQKEIQTEENRIAKQNAETSGEKDLAQAEYYKALQANELEKNPYIGKKIKAEIAQDNANTAKTMHELDTGTLGKTVGKEGTDTINNLINMAIKNYQNRNQNRNRKGNSAGGGR